MDTAIYLFTGFLEAGKTKFIKDTLSDTAFNNGKDKILLIACEEGELLYEAGELSDNITLVSFENEEDLVPERILARQKRAGANIVVIEYNGMWSIDRLYRALPEGFTVYQEIFIADSTSILQYNANMRQLVVDKLTSCELVVFNRTTDTTDKEALHKLVRGINTRAGIYYENTNGEIEIDTIKDPLPYDMNAPVVNIGDDDFAVFYRDLVENIRDYDGKTLRFLGLVTEGGELPRGLIGVGRRVMTCCADDIEYRGVIAKNVGGIKLRLGDWVRIEGTVKVEYMDLYQGEGPVLYTKKIEKTQKPKNEIVTFN